MKYLLCATVLSVIDSTMAVKVMAESVDPYSRALLALLRMEDSIRKTVLLQFRTGVPLGLTLSLTDRLADLTEENP